MNRISGKKSSKHKKYSILGKGNSKYNPSEQVIQSLNFAFKNRKTKKRNFKILWILRLNAIFNTYSLNYSNFLGYVKKANIFLNKKILAFFMYYDTGSINSIVRFLNLFS